LRDVTIDILLRTTGNEAGWLAGWLAGCLFSDNLWEQTCLDTSKEDANPREREVVLNFWQC